jgi:hypothetical protein
VHQHTAVALNAYEIDKAVANAFPLHLWVCPHLSAPQLYVQWVFTTDSLLNCRIAQEYSSSSILFSYCALVITVRR